MNAECKEDKITIYGMRFNRLSLKIHLTNDDKLNTKFLDRALGVFIKQKHT